MIDVNGASVWPGALGEAAQAALLAEVLAVMEAAPPFHPVTRWGRSMSVAMTAAGRFGWWSDARGYRYREDHPSGDVRCRSHYHCSPRQGRAMQHASSPLRHLSAGSTGRSH